MEETAHEFGVSARGFPDLVELIISGLSYEVALVYLDDIFIIGRYFEDHLYRLDLVLGQLRDAGLKIKC